VNFLGVHAAYEEGAKGSFELIRTGDAQDISTPLTVFYTLPNEINHDPSVQEADAGYDYAYLSGTTEGNSSRAR
jgi:hypothetical protein